MASKANSNHGPHSAGIFADMTVDGPEIGTLVLVVDRAKNLPNRKSMGKQSCYAAARLGKEARKTETDKRGGQTPKWDQELRFTVHDSPDYYTLKISVFSEDKRTDLIGEAFISLADVIVPGGGKSDIWQGLACKGRYSGELRVEMTYYDTRAKPEKRMEVTSVAEELRLQYGSLEPKVKRRPLPSNPHAPSSTPVNVPDRALPGRAKHGPRDYSTPVRADSLPPEALSYPYSAETLVGYSTPPVQSSLQEQEPPVQAFHEYDDNPEPQAYDSHPQSQAYHPHAQHQAYDQDPQRQPYDSRPHQPIDFLPTLPPSQRQRDALPQRRNSPQPPQQQHMRPRPQNHVLPPHAHSAPTVPVIHSRHNDHSNGNHQFQPEYSEPVPEIDYQYSQGRPRRNSALPEWQDAYDGQMHAGMPPTVHDDDMSAPPPPPMHSHSSPAVPQYGSPGYAHPQLITPSRHATAPPTAQQQRVPSSSPMPNIARDDLHYQTPQSHHPSRRGWGADEYNSSPIYSSPPAQHGYDSSPNQLPMAVGAGYGRTPPRPSSSRHSLAEAYSTPQRPHPLSQEVPRHDNRSTYYSQELEVPAAEEQRMYQRNEYITHEPAPLARSRPVSPAPSHTPASAPPASRHKNTYSIQFPVRSFESSDDNPLSRTGRPQVNTSATAAPMPRTSVSPRPSMSGSPSVPFSPDSFGVHNPNTPQSAERPPILDWNGREVDPSDHLPVDSWAPEPEKHTPSKTYGLGRDGDFGPRQIQPSSGAARLSKDTMINVRIRDRGSPASAVNVEPPPQSFAAHPEAPAPRNRLAKRAGPPQARNSMIEMPLRDHENFNPVPNPYEQQPPAVHHHHQQSSSYGRGYRERSPGPGFGGAPPSLPPKVPLDYGDRALQQQQQQRREYGGAYDYGNAGPDALSREISNIDLGPGRNGRMSTNGHGGRPAFVPVRSHRDRNSFY